MHTSPKKFLGLFTRKERWGLSARGWLVLFLLISSLTLLLVWRIHPFLALNAPVDAKILVVKGWVHEYAIKAAVDEFKSRPYERIFTTGGPIEGTGAFSSIYTTSANVGAGRLRAAGISPGLVEMAPSRVNDQDRTYSSALALRDWFRENDLSVTHINVVTEDAHARRTRLLFQKAFGNGTKVGVISVPNPDYDAKRWWRFSQGVKEVMSEGGAYIYARLFFHPGN